MYVFDSLMLWNDVFKNHSAYADQESWLVSTDLSLRNFRKLVEIKV